MPPRFTRPLPRLRRQRESGPPGGAAPSACGSFKPSSTSCSWGKSGGKERWAGRWRTRGVCVRAWARAPVCACVFNMWAEHSPALEMCARVCTCSMRVRDFYAHARSFLRVCADSLPPENITFPSHARRLKCAETDLRTVRLFLQSAAATSLTYYSHSKNRG